MFDYLLLSCIMVTAGWQNSPPLF